MSLICISLPFFTVLMRESLFRFQIFLLWLTHTFQFSLFVISVICYVMTTNPKLIVLRSAIKQSNRDTEYNIFISRERRDDIRMKHFSGIVQPPHRYNGCSHTPITISVHPITLASVAPALLDLQCMAIYEM